MILGRCFGGNEGNKNGNDGDSLDHEMSLVTGSGPGDSPRALGLCASHEKPDTRTGFVLQKKTFRNGAFGRKATNLGAVSVKTDSSREC
jgi:hypothetical protein